MLRPSSLHSPGLAEIKKKIITLSDAVDFLYHSYTRGKLEVWKQKKQKTKPLS